MLRRLGGDIFTEDLKRSRADVSVRRIYRRSLVGLIKAGQSGEELSYQTFEVHRAMKNVEENPTNNSSQMDGGIGENRRGMLRQVM